MTIIIETKFNIGDVVYVADDYYDFYPHEDPYIITDILVKADSQHTHVLYEVEHEDTIDCVPETWIFPTYAECTKWCDAHNKLL